MYNKEILNSNNKMKTTLNIIKRETGKKVNNEDLYLSNTDGNMNGNYQIISDSFNNYFLSIAEKIIHNIPYKNKIDSNNKRNSLHYLSQLFRNLFLNIKFS